MTRDRRGGVPGPVGLFLFGAVFLFGGFQAYDGGVPPDAVTVDGTVVDVGRLDRRPGRSQKYAPVVAFTAADGVSRTATPTVASPHRPVIGQVMQVIHPAGDPDAATVQTAESTWYPRIFMLIGGGVILAAVRSLVT